jgi:hypothetical protein
MALTSSMRNTLIRTALFGFFIIFTSQVRAEEARRPHHIAIAFGGAGHGSETSGFLGFDYSYRFKNDLAVFLFAEDVSGDFEVQAFGIGFGKYFDSGWKIGAGPGVEKKLETGKKLNLFHLSGGYDWHKGNWSYGPMASIDFIEQNQETYYLGWAFGYGF